MKFFYEEAANKPGVYKIINTHTDRIYIGQAKYFKKRWFDHKRSFKNGKHQNRFLRNDFKKCFQELNHDNFIEFHVIEIMEGSTKEERNSREEQYIAQYYDRQNKCYNFKQKSASNERRQCAKKKKELSIETRKIISNSAKERCKEYPELLEKLHKAQKEHFLRNPEERKKICSLGGQKRAKTIALLSPDNNVVEITNISKFGKEYGLDPDQLTAVFNKKRNCYKGWIRIGYDRNNLQRKELPENYKELCTENARDSWKNEKHRKARVEGIKKYWQGNKERKEKVANEVQNRFAKTYILLSPAQELITITNISQYCREHPEYQGSGLVAVANGRWKQYKGWTKP